MIYHKVYDFLMSILSVEIIMRGSKRKCNIPPRHIYPDIWLLGFCNVQIHHPKSTYVNDQITHPYIPQLSGGQIPIIVNLIWRLLKFFDFQLPQSNQLILK
jgi:hypothetical protein